MGDLIISGNSCYIDRWCSRWDVSNYSIIIETWMTKSEYQDLQNSIRPGAVGELYTILGKPLYYDQSWDGSNTLIITPQQDSSKGELYKTRTPKLIYPKNITSSPIEGAEGWIWVKLEGYNSGSADL